MSRTRPYTVNCAWDAEAHVWYVESSDVPGLATEAPTLEEMERKLTTMIPELLELNTELRPDTSVPFELVARKHHLARSA
jgi:predicted RNase H-like HicB family nuclease